MPDAAQVLRGGGELLGRQLLLGVHVPQAELGPHLAALEKDLAGDQGLGLDLPPVAEARRRVEIADLLDEGGRVDRREIARAPEIVGDHAIDGGARLLGAAPDEERRNGDRQRIDACRR